MLEKNTEQSWFIFKISKDVKKYSAITNLKREQFGWVGETTQAHKVQRNLVLSVFCVVSPRLTYSGRVIPNLGQETSNGYI